MNVFHTTSFSAFKKIEKTYLSPRYNTIGCFDTNTNVGSHPYMVYFTTSSESSASEMYGFRSSLIDRDTQAVRLSLELTDLNENNLRVDENFLDLESRGTFYGAKIDNRLKQRTLAILDKRWQQSIDKTELFAHVGKVLSEKIKKYEIFSIKNSQFFVSEIHTLPTKELRLCAHDWWLKGFADATNIILNIIPAPPLSEININPYYIMGVRFVHKNILKCQINIDPERNIF